MFLNESEQDPGGPFFGVEIKELRCAFGFGFVDMIIKLWVFQIHDHCNQVHPVNTELLNLVIDLIVNSFP